MSKCEREKDRRTDRHTEGKNCARQGRTFGEWASFCFLYHLALKRRIRPSLQGARHNSRSAPVSLALDTPSQTQGCRWWQARRHAAGTKEEREGAAATLSILKRRYPVPDCRIPALFPSSPSITTLEAFPSAAVHARIQRRWERCHGFSTFCMPSSLIDGLIESILLDISLVRVLSHV